MIKLIEIEDELKEENNYLENLQHQITKKYYRFYRNIPEYNKKLDDLDFKLQLKESIYEIRKKFEMAQIRRNYATVVSEFEDIIEKNEIN